MSSFEDFWDKNIIVQNIKNIIVIFLIVTIIGVLFGAECSAGILIGLNLVGVHIIMYGLIKGE